MLGAGSEILEIRPARPADAEACYAQALGRAGELGTRPLSVQCAELELGALHTRAGRDT